MTNKDSIKKIEEAHQKAHLYLAKALEALDQIDSKTEKIRNQMSVIALIGLGFELGLEKVIHKSLTEVARAMHSLKDYFLEGKNSVLVKALEIAKQKDKMIFSKFLSLQENTNEKEKLWDWLNQQIDIDKLNEKDLAIELLNYLNKVRVNIEKENLN